MGTGKDYIEIAGTVVAVIYFSEESGYTVLRVGTQDGEQLTAVGCLPYCAPGEQLIMNGEWTRHAQHGEQFKVEYARREMPISTEAIYDYLASRTISGIGPATALLIVNRFGADSLNIIENSPEELAELRGITIKKAKQISESFKKQTGIRRLMEFLVSHELRPQYAMRLYGNYGDSALQILRDNPYILSAEHIGGLFEDADKLALALDFEYDCAERIEAAVCFELRHNSKNGHCFIPRDKLIAVTAQLIEVESEAVEEGLEMLIESGEVCLSSVAGVEACYLRRLYNDETTAAKRLKQMSGQLSDTTLDIDKLIKDVEQRQNITYAQFQRDTISKAAQRQVMVITGGPGTGKTTCVCGILSLFELMGLNIMLTAPTGRAAKRMSEICGCEAYTIHRLLEAGYSKELDETTFCRDADNPLDCGAIILDECSMVDITLFSALLSAMPAECRLVIVGDADQLPSVGAGNVFLDIIRSETIETVRLTEIFRQSTESRIVSSAHMINRGEHPNLSENAGDMFFMRRTDAEKSVDTIVELCQKRLPENMKIPSMDIQVLSPTRQRECGTQSLNRRLQASLNPAAAEKKEKKIGEITFREGDKVMQIRNNYDMIWKRTDTGESGTGVFNGDIGRISAIDDAGETVYVNFDERRAAYPFELLIELEHAYAMTVHKSQGSEYRAVVLSASKGAKQLMSRGILYTAVTRARELLIIVGDDRVIDYMIDNYTQTRRYSGLRARLAE